ncbi:MAG: hypothetical protein ACN6I6_00940 [bacterium]
MRQRSDFIEYNQAVALYLKRETKKLAAMMSKGVLAHSERTLIKARLLNLEGKVTEAEELLKSHTPTSKYLKAQKNNVLSSIYDKLSRYQSAAVCNQKAIKLYHELSDNEGLFVSYLNLSINYSRLSLEELFDYNWKKAKQFVATKENQNSLIRAKVSYLAKLGKFEEALVIIQHITKSEADYNNKATFLNLEADILVRLKRFNEALEIYQNLARTNKSLTRFRVAYEYQVTLALKGQSKLKKLPPDFPRESEYFHLWNTLICLQDGDPEQAHLSWLELVRINPDKYLPEFRYKDIGDFNSHFSQYYQFLKSKISDISLNPFKPGSATYKFVHILKHSQTPLRKELIIEQIWDIPYSPDFDARFYKVVERVKKNSKVTVIMRNSTYQIQSKGPNYL